MKKSEYSGLDREIREMFYARFHMAKVMGKN